MIRDHLNYTANSTTLTDTIDACGQTRSGLANKRQAEVLLKISQPSGPATKRAGHISQALGKSSADAAAIQAVKAASSDVDCHWTTL